MYMPSVRRESSLGAKLFTGFMVTLLTCSLTLNFWLLVFGGLAALAGSGGGGSSPGGRSDVLIAGDSTRKVFLIEVTGVITDETQQRFARLLKEATDDPAIKALIVHVDTPGGTVTASDEIYQAIVRARKSKSIPVVVTQGGIATSGGYYISAAADRVFANRTTWTGNIGVIMQRFNVSKVMEKYGIEDATLVSSGAKFKDAGSMFKPENAEQREYLQSLMDQAFATFKQVIVAGRGAALKKPIDEIANGKVYTADEALALGLIDGTGGRDDAINWLKNSHSLTGMELIRLDETPTLGSLLGLSSKLTGAGAGTTKLELDASVLEPFLTPRPLYLWRGN